MSEGARARAIRSERDRRHARWPYDGAVLVKWIRCTVVDRRGFERGQRKWAGLLGEPGFRGQGGGWSRQRQGVAHIFAFWESRAFYDSFMARSHDRLAAAQSGTFNDGQARLFEYRFDVKTGFEPRFTDADLIRVAGAGCTRNAWSTSRSCRRRSGTPRWPVHRG